MVQHEALELPVSDGSTHALPRLLGLVWPLDKMAQKLGPAISSLYHMNACNTAETGYATVLLPSK